ncbi:hypothetical protein NKH77_43550 [Streptomyces sp. M19]
MTHEETRTLVAAALETGPGRTAARRAFRPRRRQPCHGAAQARGHDRPHAAEAVAETVRVLDGEGVNVLRCAVLPAGDFAGRGGLLLHYPGCTGWRPTGPRR